MNDCSESVYRLLEDMGNASRRNREEAALTIRTDTTLFPFLLQAAFEIQYKNHHKAAWILEIVLETNIELIAPHLDTFCSGLHRIENESAMRPLSKICYWIARAYVEEKNPLITQQLRPSGIQKIIESNFDWLTGNHKVATQVFAMDTLFLFGQVPGEDYDWIHTELQSVILHNISQGSPGYKSHGKKLLKLMRQKKGINRNR